MAAEHDDNNAVTGIFIDASTVMLTLYVISNRRGLARQHTVGLDGVRSTLC
jgi:hypothetical protein